MIIGILTTVIIGIIVIIGWKIVTRQFPFNKIPAIDSEIENHKTTLEYEIKSLHQRVGGLETSLFNKQQEVEELTLNNKTLQEQLANEIERNREVLSSKKSSEVRTGQISETLAPFFMDGIDPKRLRFLGNPIDYISFDDDFITFVEVKSGGSKLSFNQKRIKNLVLSKKVKWMEFRIDGKKKI